MGAHLKGNTFEDPLNLALHWLITAKFKKLPDTFYPNKKGMIRPTNHLTLLSLLLALSAINGDHLTNREDEERGRERGKELFSSRLG